MGVQKELGALANMGRFGGGKGYCKHPFISMFIISLYPDPAGSGSVF